MHIPDSGSYPQFKGNQIIGFEDKRVPSVGYGQLLVQCKANALCASDMGAYHNGSKITPGHELSGIVIAAGTGTSIKTGTPGVVFLMDFCGGCRSCLLGLTNQCLAKRADYGFTHDGGYGPFALVNENVFFPINTDLSFSEAVLLLDVMGTGGHSLKRAKLAHPDPKSLLITGSGPIGLGILAMAKLIFGNNFPVLITDMIPYRLEFAERLGGMSINIAKESLREGIKRHGFENIDIAIDSSGKGNARREAMDILAKRGVLVCVGHGENLILDISPDLIGTERTIMGSEYFCYDELPENLKLLSKNREYLGQIITHRFDIKDISEAFEVFVQHNTGKVVIEQ